MKMENRVAMIVRLSLTSMSSTKGFALDPVPGRAPAAHCVVAGGVARQRVPDDRQGEAEEAERGGALDGPAGAVLGLADADELLGVAERDLDRPAQRVELDDPTGLSFGSEEIGTSSI
jgi:hypothetical protein